MNKMITRRGTRWLASVGRGLALPFLAGIMLVLPGCFLSDHITFPAPEPKIELLNELGKAAYHGGTLYYGMMVNNGELGVESVTVTVSVFGAGGALLATGAQTQDIIIKMDEIASFEVIIPVPIGAIASETVSFSWVVQEITE